MCRMPSTANACKMHIANPGSRKTRIRLDSRVRSRRARNANQCRVTATHAWAGHDCVPCDTCTDTLLLFTAVALCSLVMRTPKCNERLPSSGFWSGKKKGDWEHNQPKDLQKYIPYEHSALRSPLEQLLCTSTRSNGLVFGESLTSQSPLVEVSVVCRSVILTGTMWAQ